MSQTGAGAESKLVGSPLHKFGGISFSYLQLVQASTARPCFSRRFPSTSAQVGGAGLSLPRRAPVARTSVTDTFRHSSVAQLVYGRHKLPSPIFVPPAPERADAAGLCRLGKHDTREAAVRRWPAFLNGFRREARRSASIEVLDRYAPQQKVGEKCALATFWRKWRPAGG
jgi:hypothetical protein